VALTDAQRRHLRRKAADSSLEVESLLRLAARGDSSDAPFLRALKAEFRWSDTGRQGRGRVVPLGRRADVVCRFWEGGYAGVVRMARGSAEAADFCAALLEELKTPESVSALLAIGGPVVERPEADVGLAVRLADGFNLLLSTPKGAVAVGAAVERRVRTFLHRLLALALAEEQRATAVCALRGVGDAESVALIAGLPPFGGCWAGLEKSAVRQIQKRARPSA
jgi:hypothetical protein